MAVNGASPGNTGTPPAPVAQDATSQPSNAAPVPSTSVDEDTQIIEDLRREHFAKQERTEDSEESEEPEESEESEEPEESKESEEPKGKDKKGPEPKAKAPKYKSAQAAVDAIAKALESGDPKKIAAAIGKPESFLKVSDAKWIAFREKTEALRERTRAVIQRETEFNHRLEKAKSDYGPAIVAAAAYREGNYAQFVELIEQITGDSYDESTRKVIKGETALSPEVKQLRKQIQELRSELQSRQKEPEQTPEQQRQQQYQRAVNAVREELAQHPIAKLKGYERLVLEAVRESWDADLQEYTLSFEDAAEQIVEERRQEARHFTRGKQLPAPRQRAAEPPPRTRASDPRTPTGEEWEKRDLTEEELIASIERDYRSGRLRPV